MRELLLVGMALVLAAGMAVAGPNANGALLVHVDESALTFCEIAGEGTDHSAYLPATCAELVARTDLQGDETTGAVSWAVVAAFPPNANPLVKAVEFGISHENIELLGNWNCADFVIESPSWPATGSGVGTVFDVARTTTMFEVYTFVGYSYTGYPAGHFTIIPHPSQGGPNFGDTSSPAIVDPVAPENLGSLGFLQDGLLPCPPEVTDGACCSADGDCLELDEAGCAAQGGTFLGVNTTCDPNPCPQPPSGACCFADGSCLVAIEVDCAAMEGLWQGQHTTCTPNPCPQPLGACCKTDGTCEDLTQSDCMFGQSNRRWLGAGTSCATDTCPEFGACCFPTGGCQMRTEQHCTDGGYSWQGPDTICDPNPCPQLGACCKPTEDPEVWTCERLLEEQCDNPNWHWYESWVCTPNPCPGPSMTIEGTWGQIKSSYKE